MDIQPPANLPMQDAPPSPVPSSSQPTMPAAPLPTDDMFSSVDRDVPVVPAKATPAMSMPAAPVAPRVAPVMPPIQVAPVPTPLPATPAPSLPPLPDQHPPIMHYVLIAFGAVVGLAVVSGIVWFFAIRRPTQQVMEALPSVANTAVTASNTDATAPADTGIVPSTATTNTSTDQGVATTSSASAGVLTVPVISPSTDGSSGQTITDKPIVTTPPAGTDVPPPTSINANASAIQFPFQTTSTSSATTTNASSQTTSSSTGAAPVGTSASSTVLSPAVDSDHDGLSDAREAELGTDPHNPDTDGDGLTDGDEVLKYHTNPLNPDTDGDGYPDGVEVHKGFNPLGAGKCANPSCEL